MAQFLETYTEWLLWQNDLEMFKVQSADMLFTHTRAKFCTVLFYSEPFSTYGWINMEESPPKDPNKVINLDMFEFKSTSVDITCTIFVRLTVS